MNSKDSDSNQLTYRFVSNSNKSNSSEDFSELCDETNKQVLNCFYLF